MIAAVQNVRILMRHSESKPKACAQALRMPMQSNTCALCTAIVRLCTLTERATRALLLSDKEPIIETKMFPFYIHVKKY